MRWIWFSLSLVTSVLGAGEVPRPEYPQPQFERAQWLSLNGTWEFEFDDRNAGMPAAFTRKIVVPFAFETPRSGIHDTTFHPWVWYRRSFTVPADWRNRRVLLHFGAVDYRAWVWLNGQLLGTHEGGSTPFRFDITEQLKPGANTIVVKAEDPPQDRFIPRGKQYWELKSRGIFYTRTSGIWQPVWLEATGDAYLDKVRITTHLDGRVRFEAKLGRTAPELEFGAEVLYRGAPVAQGRVKVAGAAAHLELRVPNPQFWMVNNPNLYDVRYELRRGETVLDRVTSYFGIREIAISNGRIWINGRSVYLKWVLDQGYWPESTLTPPSDDAMRFDIEAAKEMGFNGCRKHQKVEDPRFLYWADKLGFLVSGEMPNAYEFDADYAARFTREWLEAVERDYNHPSVIMWVPINESWGTPNLRDAQQQSHLRANYWLTKSLDPTRPVVENDGWEHVDTLDLFTIHDYAATGERLLARYKDLGKPGARIPDNARAIFAPGNSYTGAPFLLSEFGGIAFIPEGARVPGDAWGYAGVEKTAEAALARLRGLYEAIAKIDAWAGICYTQITDVEQEVNGLLTYDRKKKFDPAAIRELNALLP
jgi:beta-galactosidase/beta-glucuronidase